METPSYVDNRIKYQRALAAAKDPSNEAEVKEIYTSFGGNVIGEEVVLSETKEETKMPEEVIAVEEIPAIVEEVAMPEEVISEEVIEEEMAEAPAEEVADEVAIEDGVTPEVIE